jgi:hypothetical protein
MNYLLVIVVIGTGLVFFMSWHGIVGALLLGLDILGLDFYWQWVRWLSIKKINRPGGSWRFVYGFFIRAGNVLLWLKIGQAWLTPRAFIICGAIALALPVTNICGAYLLSGGVFKDGNDK